MLDLEGSVDRVVLVVDAVTVVVSVVDMVGGGRVERVGSGRGLLRRYGYGLWEWVRAFRRW